MTILAHLAVGLIAALHIYIMVVEMFFWDSPYGRKAFGTTAEFSASTKVLAGNQGLYNGFLAAGLIWGLLSSQAGVEQFFLACVLVAGLYGGLTSHRKILLIQALPATIALVLVYLAS